MRRRTVLATLPTLFAGCVGADDSPDDATMKAMTTGKTSTVTTTAPTTTTNETPAETTTQKQYDLIPADPASMTETEVRHRLADHDCTEFTDLPTTCPGDDDRLDVSISPTVGRLPDSTVEFTVENQSDDEFKTGHYGWILRKWDGTRWRRLAPVAIAASLGHILPSKSHTHRITVAEDKVARNTDAYHTRTDVTIGGLGPGVYGFETSGYFKSSPDEELAGAAVFGFAGTAPPVRPTDDVKSVTKNGSTLLVHADGPSDRRREFAITLVDGEADVELLPEHVHQLAPLRNTLSYAATDGIDTIRYIGHDGVNMADLYLTYLMPENATRYGFRDYTFEVSVERP